MLHHREVAAFFARIDLQAQVITAASLAALQDPQFESADAGASHTYPMQAGNIRKNAYICIKGRPCKASVR
jgi:hypothetical protein